MRHSGTRLTRLHLGVGMGALLSAWVSKLSCPDAGFGT